MKWRLKFLSAGISRPVIRIVYAGSDDGPCVQLIKLGIIGVPVRWDTFVGFPWLQEHLPH